MAYPQWLDSDGDITADGRKLIEHYESQFSEADKGNDITALNQLTGDVKFYYQHYKMEGKGLPELIEAARVKFLREFGKSVAHRGWDNLLYIQEQAKQAEKVEQNSEATNDLTEQLEQLREELLGEITKVKRENTRLKNKVNALEADESDDDKATGDDADAEDEDDEDESEADEDSDEEDGDDETD